MEKENQEEAREFESDLVLNENNISKENQDIENEKKSNEEKTNNQNTEQTSEQVQTSNESINMNEVPKKVETKVNSDKNKKDSYNNLWKC